jgi:hypothetical protein
MSYQPLNATRTLNRREIFDLARAGFVLAITVVMAVPPKVFGADPRLQDVLSIEAKK